MQARWESESAFKEDGQNLTIIAAALDPRFRKMKFLSPDDALKVKVQIQALAIDVKTAQQQLARNEQGASASPQKKNTSKSLLDTLLDLDSEGEDSTEGIGQEDSVIARSYFVLPCFWIVTSSLQSSLPPARYAPLQPTSCFTPS
ncbi:unnamed protein product [Boreogadus saida]